jgi:hypothetical protein
MSTADLGHGELTLKNRWLKFSVYIYIIYRRPKAKVTQVILSGSEKNAKEGFLPNLPKSEIDDFGKNVQCINLYSHLNNGLDCTTQLYSYVHTVHEW